MNYEDCNPSEIETPDGLSDERLKPQIERLRSLRSAWGALASSCLTPQARKIADTGRAVTELLVSLSGRAGELSETDLATANRRLDEFEATMQKLISQVPVSQFRSSLPVMIQSDRQGLLDLLDTMIAETEENAERIESADRPDRLSDHAALYQRRHVRRTGSFRSRHTHVAHGCTLRIRRYE